jgi:RNA polymerase sigma factor for flagellar operon FliA
MATTEVKNKIVEQHTPLVWSIAKQVKKTLSPRIEIDDLVGYGMTGLLEAAERFDPNHGANFSTFGYYRIRGAIYDGLRSMGWLSRSEYQKTRMGERANALLESHSSRDASATRDNRSTSEHVDDLATQVSQLVTIFVTSLEALSETEFEDHNARKQDVVFEEKQSKKVLHMAISSLPPEDKELLRLYYFEDLSLEEVGNRIGLSKSWTCRRHSQVIQRLTSNFKQITEQKRPEKKAAPPRMRVSAST